MSAAIAWMLVALVVCTTASARELPLFRPIDANDSVLVVAPHPDDESLCCGGLIDTARRAGAAVSIVWVTNGDGFRWDAMVVERTLRPRAGAYVELGRRRAEEARTAAAMLNVPADSLFFLSYPDRGVLSLLLDHYYPDTPWRSRFTGEHAVVYNFAVREGASYDGEDLERDFHEVLDRVKPTLVLAPSTEDTHPDHRAAGILTWRAMLARGELHNARFWIVHGGRGWPKPRGYRPNLAQTIPPRGVGMDWEQFPLDEAARESKLRAVTAHATQMKVMARVMRSHVRSRELYSRTPQPPLSSCEEPVPCEFEDGTLMEESGL
jgi:LmbE family N-acetylglucosaminyl deacetylase